MNDSLEEPPCCPAVTHMPLQWSNYTKLNLYLPESHAWSAAVFVCLWGELGREGRIFTMPMIDRPVQHNSYSRGIRIYFPRALVSFFLPLCRLILTKRGRFWRASIFRAPVTNKEKRAAGSRRGLRCLVGQKRQERHKHNKMTNSPIPKLF